MDKFIDFAFTVMRVKESVTWKYLGGEGSRSTLKLQRWDETLGKAVNMLTLGEFVGTSDDVQTLEFDFEYSQNNKLWGPGEKGVLLPTS